MPKVTDFRRDHGPSVTPGTSRPWSWLCSPRFGHAGGTLSFSTLVQTQPTKRTKIRVVAKEEVVKSFPAGLGGFSF